MNSIVGPIFNENFAEKRGLWSSEQCIGLIDKRIFQSLGVIFGYYSMGPMDIQTPDARRDSVDIIQMITKCSFA